MKNKKIIFSLVFVLLASLALVGCNKNKTTEATHVHTFDKEVRTAETLASDATCTKKATYYYTCSGCGAISTDKTFEYGDLMEHTWSEAYSSDENGHYHICTVCNAHSNTEEHNYSQYVLKTAPKTEGETSTDGSATYTCSICNHTKDVAIKIVSVSEAKKLSPSDDIIYVRGIVVTPLYTASNSELLIQDEKTQEFFSVRGLGEYIYDSTSKTLLTSTFKKGDLVEIPCHVISSSSDGVDNTKNVLSALLSQTNTEAASCVKESGKEIKALREYNSEDVTVIESQDELNAFLVANKNVNTESFYKVIKLNGLLKVRTTSEGIYFTFNSSATKDEDAKVLTYLPQFRDINIKVLLGNTAANVLGLKDATREYTGADNTFKGEIYCLCFGGNTNYYQFTILSKEDIVDKSSGLVNTNDATHYYLTMNGTKVYEENHNFEKSGHTDATHTSVGGDVYTCKDCGYSYCKNDEAKITEHLTVAQAIEAGKTVSYIEKNNKYYHYFTCTCGELVEIEFDLAGMAAENDEVVEATCLAEGHHTYTCTICGQSHTVVLPIVSHNMTKHDAVEATIEQDGNIEYYTCSNECCKDKYYILENEKYKEVSDITDYFCTEHSWGELNEAKPASCTEEGHVAYYECSHCHKYANENKEIITTITIEKVDHTKETHEKLDPTCTEKGHSEYQECTVCHEKFNYQEYEAKGHSYTLAEYGYKQVTKQGSVVAGDRIIIVVEDEDQTIGNVLNSESTAQRAPKVAVTITDNVLTPTDTINVFTVGDYQKKASTGIQGYFSLLSSLDNVYITSSSKSVDALNSEATASKNGSSWAISFDNDGYATFQAAGTNPKGYLAYDSASGEFYCSDTASKFRVFKYTVVKNNGYVDGTDVTCTTDGTLGHYYCETCKKYFDLDGKEIENITVAHEGHNYEATFEWKYTYNIYEEKTPYALVTVKCANCGDIIADKISVTASKIVENVTLDLVDADAPTCTTGCTLTLTVSYTVEINGENVTFKDTQEHEFAALGHNYEMKVFTIPTVDVADSGSYGEECKYCHVKHSYAINMYDVSDLSTLTPNQESDATKTVMFVRGYVVTTVSNKNNVELLIKDYTTNQMIGIVDAGKSIVGTTTNGELIMGNNTYPIRRGDLIYIPCDYRVLAAGTDATADDNKKVLWAHVGDVGMNWSNHKETDDEETAYDETQGIIRGHIDNLTFDYTDSSITTISTQTELATFLASDGSCAANAYKIVKLSGTIYGIGYYPTKISATEPIVTVETSVSQSFVRFFFDNTAVTNLTSQKIEGKWSPVFSYENLYMATESASDNTYAYEIFGEEKDEKISTSYSSPASFCGDIYCVFVGGNDLYAMFDIVSTYTETFDTDETTVKTHKNAAVTPYFEGTLTTPTKTTYYLTDVNEDDFAIDYTGGKITYNTAYSGTGSFERATYYTGITKASTLKTKCTNEAEVIASMKENGVGTYEIKFSHGGQNFSYEVEVINKTLTSITAPSTTNLYYTTKSLKGLILTGLKIKANYSDSTYEEIDLLSSYITGTIDDGEQDLTITYNEKTITWKVNIACDYYYVLYGVNGETGLASAPVAGNVILIVAGTANKVVADKSGSTTDYKGNTDVTVANNQIAYDESYAELTVYNGNSSGTLSFKNENSKVLVSNSKEATALGYQNTITDSTSFVLSTIEIDSKEYSTLGCSRTGISYIGYNTTNGFYRPFVATDSTATDVVALRIFVKYSHTTGAAVVVSND